MNRSAIIRHNAKLIREHVRGKTKSERKAIYALIAGGPLALVAQVASMLVKAHTEVNIEVQSHGADYDRIVRSIEQGARARSANDHRFRL
ncbi:MULTISPECIES: hypothetical protein [unclassified Rhizobium]|uniref:hypothetical protein n=1 Tax=unclassified Rhizobium TaxID=2613769 RepID=UPI00288A69F6|nr:MULTISPECIES: hypothetical protein [unclassified Rhizobium]